MNQVMVSVVDGGGIVFNYKIASKMMGFVGLLTEGLIIKMS